MLRCVWRLCVVSVWEMQAIHTTVSKRDSPRLACLTSPRVDIDIVLLLDVPGERRERS